MVYDENRDIVLGHEFVGEVVAHGPGCSDQFPIGTRVTSIPILLIDGGVGGTKVIGQHPEAQGSFGELLVVSEMMARAVPGDVSNDAVAVVDAFAVGEFYVRSSAIEPGEIGIVIGAGAVGLSAVAALAARGIDPIIDSCEMWTRIFAAGGWYTGDTIDCTAATHKGVTIQFGGGPHPEDWYGTLDAVCAGRLDPLPSIGKVIGLDEVPDALELTRKSEGPPRIVVHPNG